MTENNFGNMRPIAKVGDLVRCLGYGAKLFQIDAYTHELSYDSENAFEDIYYDMTDVLTHDYTLGGQEDIYVVCPAERSDDYLAQYLRNPPEDKPTNGEMPSELLREILGGMIGENNPNKGANEMSKERRLTPREESSQEAHRRKQEREGRSDKVDVLLDELNDYKTLISMFGDIDNEYQTKIDEVKSELAELTKSDTEEDE